MQILVDPDTYNFLNVGGVAMLQFAVARLRALWPTACIQVITLDPDTLAIHCPGVVPIPVNSRYTWLGDDYLLGRIHQFLPKATSQQLGRLKRSLGYYSPALLEAMIHLRMRMRPTDNGDPRPFLEAVNCADLFVVTGAGPWYDADRRSAYMLLNTLEMVIRRGIPIAMFGQNIGPMHDPELIARAKKILPLVSLIAVRERLSAPCILEAFAVSADRVVITGDDAIELAYQARAARSGNGIGVNLRVSTNAEVDHNFINILRPVLQEFASMHNAPLLPVPIGFNKHTHDSRSIQQLLAGYDDRSDGGQSLDTPLKIIEQIGRCRIVVTGAYHAAVFALAQGIPAVCLAKSEYFVQKLLGLADHFGTGCQVVFLNEADVSGKVRAAMDRAWSSADDVRLPLQQAAARQIEMSRSAYNQLKELVEFRSVMG